MKRFLRSSLLSFCGLFMVTAVIANTARADVRLPSLISDGMVLQQGMAVPLWGWADEGESVTVEFQNQKVTARAKDGKWMVRLKSLKAGGPFTLTVSGKNKIELKNVLVGEVWLCSGQSNMEWPVNASLNPEEERAAANYPKIRHIKVPHVPADKPQPDVATGGWQVCSPDTVGDFTAVGYFFGRRLHQELDVPIGLIGSNWGGTRIEPWTPPEGFKHIPALKDIADNLA